MTSEPDVSLRPATDDDREFLFETYARTRDEELAITGWSGAEKEAFLRMQFALQDSQYRAHYPGADLLVIKAHGEDVGRLYVYRPPGEIRIMDIALLPEWRGHGIGSRLLRDLLAEAEATGAAVGLYVEGHNPARRLYERLGFAEVEKGPVYDRLVWTSPAAATTG